MRSFLIVANQTIGGEPLKAAIDERLATGPARFYVVVPATPVGGGMTWDETETQKAARERLDAVVERLRTAGAEADGC